MNEGTEFYRVDTTKYHIFNTSRLLTQQGNNIHLLDTIL